MTTQTLKVTGMHCPKCESRIEKAVSALEGVESVQASHENNTCVVTFDGKENTMKAIKAAIFSFDFVVE